MLPGPSSGTYRYRRTMSQRRANRPFIIGVAGGTASGKTSVCECTFSTPVVFTVIPSNDDTPVHAFETICLVCCCIHARLSRAGTKIIADLRQDKEFKVRLLYWSRACAEIFSSCTKSV